MYTQAKDVCVKVAIATAAHLTGTVTDEQSRVDISDVGCILTVMFENESLWSKVSDMKTSIYEVCVSDIFPSFLFHFSGGIFFLITTYPMIYRYYNFWTGC